jgi:hypothetical protein
MKTPTAARPLSEGECQFARRFEMLAVKAEVSESDSLPPERERSRSRAIELRGDAMDNHK